MNSVPNGPVNQILPAYPCPDDIAHWRLALFKGFLGCLADQAKIDLRDRPRRQRMRIE
jgi:hypothetical protein